MNQKNLITLLVLIVIVVTALVGSNIYHSAVTSTIPEILAIQVKPINPTFQTKVLDELKKRTKVSPQLNAPPPVITPTPAAQTPLVRPSPTPLPTTQQVQKP